MKIKITEIEASPEDLRQCRSISDDFTLMLKSILNPFAYGGTNVIDINESEGNE